MTTTAVSTVCRSRWGFHPCNYEEFLKLKEAHGLLYRAYRDVKRFIRWDDRLPHNRTGSRPSCPTAFISTGYHRLDKHAFCGRGFVDCKVREGFSRNLYLHMLHQYEKARRPVASPEDVEPLDLPDNLNEIVEKLREYYG